MDELDEPYDVIGKTRLLGTDTNMENMQKQNTQEAVAGDLSGHQLTIVASVV